jgi:predicted acylesterase/phospholipase RssA
MRKLSCVIPAIKEVVMTGTYVEEFTENDKGKKKKLKGGNEEGQLYVFDADSEPDLEVAVAVHASASFPGAFKPVDIQLASGLTVRFIDGGVMNNTPTSSSLANERELDALPQQRGISYVFEDEGTAEGLKKGRVDPAVGLGTRLKDWFVGSDNAAGEYAKNKALAERPEEVVVVPLTIDLPGLQVDMRGTFSGTLNFSPPMEARVGLREKTEAATNEQITRESADRTREFASDAQMFVSIPLAELQTLAAGGYAGAAAALAFRQQVAANIVADMLYPVLDPRQRPR